MNDWAVTLIVAIITSSPGIVALWRGLRKENAEAETSYQALYEKSVNRIAQLEKRVSKLEKIVDQFEEVLAGAHKLFHQVKALGGTPVYEPPDRRIANEESYE
jgi:phosphoserine phosphatase